MSALNYNTRTQTSTKEFSFGDLWTLNLVWLKKQKKEYNTLMQLRVKDAVLSTVDAILTRGDIFMNLYVCFHSFLSAQSIEKKHCYA